MENSIAIFQITIDDYSQTLHNNADGELTVLKGNNSTEVPAFGWMKDDCIHIMGFEDEGYLVR